MEATNGRWLGIICWSRQLCGISTRLCVTLWTIGWLFGNATISCSPSDVTTAIRSPTNGWWSLLSTTFTKQYGQYVVAVWKYVCRSTSTDATCPPDAHFSRFHAFEQLLSISQFTQYHVTTATLEPRTFAFEQSQPSRVTPFVTFSKLRKIASTRNFTIESDHHVYRIRWWIRHRGIRRTQWSLSSFFLLKKELF